MNIVESNITGSSSASEEHYNWPSKWGADNLTPEAIPKTDSNHVLVDSELSTDGDTVDSTVPVRAPEIAISSGEYYTYIQGGTQADDVTLTLPDALPEADGCVMTGADDGTMAWQAPSDAGLVEGAGTAGTVPKWTDGNTLGNSLITDDGSSVGIPSGKQLWMAGGDSTLFVANSSSNPQISLGTGSNLVYQYGEIQANSSAFILRGKASTVDLQYSINSTIRATIKGDDSKLLVDKISELTSTAGVTVNVNSVFESDGTLRFDSTATVWEDLRVADTSVRLGVTAPTLAAFGPSGNLRTLQFESSKHQEVEFTIQMPHSWKAGRVYPHVHWTPVSATTGNVVWELEYSWADINGTFGAPSTMATDATSAGGTAWVHKMTRLKDGSGNDYIDGSSNGISSMLVCRLHRNAGSGSDTLAANVAFLEFDLHYEIDTVGSRTESSK